MHGKAEGRLKLRRLCTCNVGESVELLLGNSGEEAALTKSQACSGRHCGRTFLPSTRTCLLMPCLPEYAGIEPSSQQVERRYHGRVTMPVAKPCHLAMEYTLSSHHLLPHHTWHGRHKRFIGPTVLTCVLRNEREPREHRAEQC